MSRKAIIRISEAGTGIEPASGRGRYDVWRCGASFVAKPNILMFNRSLLYWVIHGATNVALFTSVFTGSWSG